MNENAICKKKTKTKNYISQKCDGEGRNEGVFLNESSPIEAFCVYQIVLSTLKFIEIESYS